MALMTDDCVFENTSPAPDGERLVGQAAVRAFWQALVDGTPAARFDAEELIACGDRCFVRWRYDYGAGHIRGIDAFTVRDGKVAEKLAYVKG
jgi:ketosteroid isomerase-like protein